MLNRRLTVLSCRGQRRVKFWICRRDVELARVDGLNQSGSWEMTAASIQGCAGRCDWRKVEGLSSSDECRKSWLRPLGTRVALACRCLVSAPILRVRSLCPRGLYDKAINALLFPSFDRYLISSAETVSPPSRVMILFKTSLLICAVTGLTEPSQKPKLTRPGCLLAQYVQ